VVLLTTRPKPPRGQCRAHQHHRRAHEDCHEAVPDLRRQFLDAGSARLGVRPDARHADAGIVDDGFDDAELGTGGGHGTLAARFSAEIGDDGMQTIPRSIVLGGKSTQRGLVAIDRGNRMPCGEKHVRYHAADSAGGAS
jgi:hypothetical protein